MKIGVQIFRKEFVEHQRKAASMKNSRVLMLTMVCFILFLAVPPVISAMEKVKFATVEWEPYYGSKLKNQGFVSEITREAFQRVGYEINIRFMPWKRALHDSKNGYYDALLGLYFSKERNEWIEYSQPLVDVQLVFFSKKGRNITYDKLSDLKPYRIGIERSFVYTEAFDKADYLNKEPVRNIFINFNKLMKDRVDLVAASKFVFLHMVKTKYPSALDKIEILPRPLTVNTIYNGFPKKKPSTKRLVTDFNKGLKSIKMDGTFDTIMQRHGFK